MKAVTLQRVILAKCLKISNKSSLRQRTGSGSYKFKNGLITAKV